MMLYNGKGWYVLRTGNPVASGGSVTPLNGAPTPVPGDIHAAGLFATWTDPQKPNSNPAVPIGSPYNWMTLTVKTNTIKVELTTIETTRVLVTGYVGAQYQVYSVMDNIPRAYLGPFNTLRAGLGGGCELANNTSWTTCKTGTGRACMDTGHNQARYADFDNLSLSGGAGYDIHGSCCHNNGTCTLELPETCQAAGDQFGGSNTTCATATCCSHGTYVWADADADGDVDAEDFAKFQRCYTGPEASMSSDLKCKCFDRPTSDNHVDNGDYLEFVNCETGAGVPWSPSFPAGCTP
jgi:hypothetical protein